MGGPAATMIKYTEASTVYVDGDRATNGHSDCDSWYGTLSEAKTRCTENPQCNVLHDFNGDGINWRACRSVTSQNGGPAATMIKSQRTNQLPRAPQPESSGSKTHSELLAEFGDDMLSDERRLEQPAQPSGVETRLELLHIR